MSEPSSAKEIVNASGLNIFPSNPSSVKSGREDDDDDEDAEDDRPAHFLRRVEHGLDFAGVRDALCPDRAFSVRCR